MQTELVKISKLKPNPNNPRTIKDEKYAKLLQSLIDFPEMLNVRPIVVNNDLMVLGGNMRLTALKELKYKEVPVIIAKEFTADKEREFVIKDNANFGEWDWDLLNIDFKDDELVEWGLDLPDIDTILDEPTNLDDDTLPNKKLSDRFIIPPFSVLDTKQGAWQQRKNYWLSLGIKSEEGRDASVGGSKMVAKYIDGIRETGLVTDTDTSIFDPVLCELSYQWFNIPNGNILDPFAGGSVRGIVASKLGFNYLGNDLRQEQIDANRINAVDVLGESKNYPTWTCGDSLDIDKIAKDYKADIIFSCPPYADLEVYSKDEKDISNMDYDKFLLTYKEIIRKSCDMLKNDRFAVFVVGDVRDKKGFYRNFVSDTIMAFWNCGVILYNEMILVNAVGSLAIRAGKQFSTGRKVGKQHQNVLVFYKGNPKNIKANYPELDLSYIENEIEE